MCTEPSSDTVPAAGPGKSPLDAVRDVAVLEVRPPALGRPVGDAVLVEPHRLPRLRAARPLRPAVEVLIRPGPDVVLRLPGLADDVPAVLVKPRVLPVALDHERRRRRDVALLPAHALLLVVRVQPDEARGDVPFFRAFFRRTAWRTAWRTPRQSPLDAVRDVAVLVVRPPAPGRPVGDAVLVEPHRLPRLFAARPLRPPVEVLVRPGPDVVLRLPGLADDVAAVLVEPRVLPVALDHERRRRRDVALLPRHALLLVVRVQPDEARGDVVLVRVNVVVDAEALPAPAEAQQPAVAPPLERVPRAVLPRLGAHDAVRGAARRGRVERLEEGVLRLGHERAVVRAAGPDGGPGLVEGAGLDERVDVLVEVLERGLDAVRRHGVVDVQDILGSDGPVLDGHVGFIHAPFDLCAVRRDDVGVVEQVGPGRCGYVDSVLLREELDELLREQDVAGCTKRMDNGVQQPRCRCQGVSVGEFATARDEDVSAVGCDATPRLSIDYGYVIKARQNRFNHAQITCVAAGHEVRALQALGDGDALVEHLEPDSVQRPRQVEHPVQVPFWLMW
ncbi:hypothetical protein BN1708_002786 [Verticillium longisporum]|uniref:Uncharacterized protein n=1 Tax=Verticillium longisporum TaxID=100787 RepID=A0A0G4L1H7_VERLO|nr:hypothetical protein BN1708_002786 [Verticillium longisporum]